MFGDAEKRREKRLRKRFPPDYVLVLTSSELDAYIDVLDTLLRQFRWDHISQTYVKDPDAVRHRMAYHRHLLEVKAGAIQDLSHLLTIKHLGSLWMGLGAIPVLCPDAPTPEIGDRIVLSPWEVSHLAVYPTHLEWEPKTHAQRQQWRAHLEWRFGAYGPRYFHLCLERLRMAAGRSTRCVLCARPVLPPKAGEGYSPAGKGESAVHVTAKLCLACLRRKLARRADEWDDMYEHDRERLVFRLLQGPRGPLP